MLNLQILSDAASCARHLYLTICPNSTSFIVPAMPRVLLCRLQDMFRFARALHDVIASGACCVPCGHCFAQCCCAIGPSGTVAVRVSTSLKSRTRMLVIVLLGADNHWNLDVCLRGTCLGALRPNSKSPHCSWRAFWGHVWRGGGARRVPRKHVKSNVMTSHWCTILRTARS